MFTPALTAPTFDMSTPVQWQSMASLSSTVDHTVNSLSSSRGGRNVSHAPLTPGVMLSFPQVTHKDVVKAVATAQVLKATEQWVGELHNVIIPTGATSTTTPHHNPPAETPVSPDAILSDIMDHADFVSHNVGALSGLAVEAAGVLMTSALGGMAGALLPSNLVGVAVAPLGGLAAGVGAGLLGAISGAIGTSIGVSLLSHPILLPLNLVVIPAIAAALYTPIAFLLPAHWVANAYRLATFLPNLAVTVSLAVLFGSLGFMFSPLHIMGGIVGILLGISIGIGLRLLNLTVVPLLMVVASAVVSALLVPLHLIVAIILLGVPLTLGAMIVSGIVGVIVGSLPGALVGALVFGGVGALIGSIVSATIGVMVLALMVGAGGAIGGLGLGALLTLPLALIAGILMTAVAPFPPGKHTSGSPFIDRFLRAPSTARLLDLIEVLKTGDATTARREWQFYRQHAQFAMGGALLGMLLGGLAGATAGIPSALPGAILGAVAGTLIGVLAAPLGRLLAAPIGALGMLMIARVSAVIMSVMAHSVIYGALAMMASGINALVVGGVVGGIVGLFNTMALHALIAAHSLPMSTLLHVVVTAVLLIIETGIFVLGGMYVATIIPRISLLSGLVMILAGLAGALPLSILLPIVGVIIAIPGWIMAGIGLLAAIMGALSLPVAGLLGVIVGWMLSLVAKLVTIVIRLAVLVGTSLFSLAIGGLLATFAAPLLGFPLPVATAVAVAFFLLPGILPAFLGSQLLALIAALVTAPLWKGIAGIAGGILGAIMAVINPLAIITAPLGVGIPAIMGAILGGIVTGGIGSFLTALAGIATGSLAGGVVGTVADGLRSAGAIGASVQPAPKMAKNIIDSAPIPRKIVVSETTFTIPAQQHPFYGMKNVWNTTISHAEVVPVTALV